MHGTTGAWRSLTRGAHRSSFYQCVRHTVIVAGDLDMIINADGGFFPFWITIGLKWQWFENRAINAFEHGFAAAGQFLERLAVELREQIGDGPIQLMNPIAEACSYQFNYNLNKSVDQAI